MEVPFQRGVTFGFYARRGVYSSPWSKEQIRKMKQLNVEYVALIATVFREACGSTREFLDLAESPGELELARMIDFIHAEGLKVMLRPMLETHDGNGRLQVWFPDDRERIPGKNLRFLETLVCQFSRPDPSLRHARPRDRLRTVRPRQ